MMLRSSFRTLSVRLVLLLLVSSTALADWDLQFGAQGRTYSAGAVGQAAIGHWFLLWGENPIPKLPRIGPREDGRSSWQFGYVRPVLYLQSAGVMNRATAELEIFPVSIFGFAVGQGFHQRPKISGQFNCDQVHCQGVLDRTTLRSQLVFGMRGFFGALVLRKEWVTTPDSSRPFVDEGLGVTGNPGRDQLMTTIGVAGFHLHPRWSIGTQFIHARAIHAGNDSLTSVAFVNHFRGSTSYILGGGTYGSDFVKTGFTAVAMFTINQLRPIGFL